METFQLHFLSFCVLNVSERPQPVEPKKVSVCEHKGYLLNMCTVVYDRGMLNHTLTILTHFQCERSHEARKKVLQQNCREKLQQRRK